MIFNVNDIVRVRLTDRGREIHREIHDQLCRELPSYKAPYLFRLPEVDGWSKWQFWVLMATFGPYMAMALPPPFEEIELPDPKDVGKHNEQQT